MSIEKTPVIKTIPDAWFAMRGTPLLIFLVCLMGWTLTNMDQSLFAFAIPAILTEFDEKLETVGWILSLSYIVASFTAVAFGLLADRYGRKVVFVSTMVGSALLVGAHALVTDVTMLAIMRTAGFAVSVGLAPIAITYTTEAAPARLRGLMTGFLGAGFPLGWFLAAMIAAPLMGVYGWRSTFLPALIVVPLALLLVRYLPESDLYKRSVSTSVQEGGVDNISWTRRFLELFSPAFRKRTLLSSTCYFMVGGAYAGTAFYFPSYFNEVRGYDQQTATLVVGVSYGIGILGYIGSSVVGEFFWTRRNTVSLWLVLGAAAMAGLIWIPTTLSGDVFWFSIMAAFFYGSNATLATFVSELFPTRLRATGVSVCVILGLNLGHIAFPPLVAIAVGTLGWQWAFALATIPALLIGAAALLGIENIESGLDLDEIAS